MELINPSRFAKDHFSCLMFLETLCVDYRGEMSDLRRMSMRTNHRTHPSLGYWRSTPRWDPLWDTRVWNSGVGNVLVAQVDHDDWDCLADFEEAGLVSNDGTEMSLKLRLTDRGRWLAEQLRVWRSAGKRLIDFRLMPETWCGIVEKHQGHVQAVAR